MDEEEMWQAVLRNDRSYDGRFFYGVKTTGIYCRPSCPSKVPKRENVCFFRTSEEAKKAGFRPCKRCRSDLVGYEPLKEMAEKIKKKIDDSYHEQSILYRELSQMGMTERRLSDIFRDIYGITPKAYLDKLRLEEAERLLAEGDKKISDIAWEAGFGSLSSFYKLFKKEKHMSPREYRERAR